MRRVLLELRALAKGAIPFASDSEEAAARVIQSVHMPANNGEGTTLELEEGADTACDGEPMELVEEMIEAAAAICEQPFVGSAAYVAAAANGQPAPRCGAAQQLSALSTLQL